MIEFLYPSWFWLLLLIPAYVAFEVFVKRKKQPTLPFSAFNQLKQAGAKNSLFIYLFIVIRCLAIVALVFALVRPRQALKKQEVTGKGIDIVLAVDVSGSMLALDLKPDNRLEAAKKVAAEFIDKRKNDRIGIVTFAEHAYTKCPLTLDYNILKLINSKLEVDREASGTAVGVGLATAVARLKNSKAKNKIIILITDGKNNTGSVNPLDAAEIASVKGIKVYTIGVGKEGMAPFPAIDPFSGRTVYRQMRVEIDMDTLNEIAKITGTKKARRAQNTEELAEIMALIDKYEKTEYKIRNYFKYNEKFYVFLLIGVGLILLELMLKTVFRRQVI